MRQLLGLEQRWLPLAGLACALAVLMAGRIVAQDAPAQPTTATPAATATPPLTLESVKKDADNAALAGHNAWMLTSSALVLFMTAPGLAMFYGGLVRKKNVLSVIMQCMFLMALNTVIWGLYAYSLSFGGYDAATPNNSPLYIGNSDYVLMHNVAREWDATANAPKEFMQGAITRYVHMLFQGMFFIITPALICGAFAERMKFSAMALFMILWDTIVYCPLAHWVWGGGLLFFGREGAWAGGALDFAGGTVVHISSGTSALICALVIGKRVGFGQEDMRPHNLTYTALGAAMLWVGWFGFNAGSELMSDGIAASAFCVTHFAAAAGGLAWAGYDWIMRGKPTVLGTASGIVAGLVCITPASGYVNPMPALIMGATAGIVCAFACSKIKAAFGYDDALDVFGVHGVGGTLGALLTGVFATRAVSNLANGKPLGLIEGGGVITGQIVAVVVTWVLSMAATFIILKIVDAVVGIRVTQQEEVLGLDVSQHEEEGYIFA